MSKPALTTEDVILEMAKASMSPDDVILELARMSLDLWKALEFALSHDCRGDTAEEVLRMVVRGE